ncbi:peptidase m61 domain-containing protein [Stachybotrys elegans]|uniref:Peptidase m61 domain-containing protein n=1 Tax=Stachybotrys elegans TaxID=80388 RepID=A0A8K0WM99_9HYPO|nr:peptidase m61 domain-containing protein [Stachybotrys elegans]
MPTMRILHIVVDLREAVRGLLHVEVEIPVQSATVAALTTPLWIQESHRDNGPIAGIAGLHFWACNRMLRWRRNPMVASEFHVDVPPNAEIIHASFDAIVTRKVTRRIVMLGWEHVLLYPSHRNIAHISIQAQVIIPRGWGVSTALQNLGPVHSSDTPDGSGKILAYQPTRLGRLADSPILTGLHFSALPITSDHRHMLCVAGDTAESVAIPKATLGKLAELVRETCSVFGSRHYDVFYFLLALTDHWPECGGAEHYDSCDIYMPSKALLGAETLREYGPLLAHEFIHSWNGKYRRPEGHAPPDFATPLDGRLLWVYEGLTQYYEGVISVRSGIVSPQSYLAELARNVAWLQGRSGRLWRSTEDTGTGARLRASSSWENWERSTQDYYVEEVMLWLEVDAIIRTESNGSRSLDHFSRIFFGSRVTTEPRMIPYTLEGIVSHLNKVVSHDWHSLFCRKVLNPSPHVNVEGIERSGYQFVRKDSPQAGQSKDDSITDAIWNSVGVRVGKDGRVQDVRRYGPGDVAKLAPQQTISKIDGEAFNLHKFAVTIHSRKGNDSPIRLTMTQEGDEWSTNIRYVEGLWYPWLERQPGTIDILSQILKSEGKCHGGGDSS